MDIKIEENLVVINFKANNRDEVIIELAKLLKKEGCVKESFLNAVIEREKHFPTGLPTLPLAIAIPHTDAEHCLHSAVAVATLQEPVKFVLMGDGTTTVDAKAVFLLSLNRNQDRAVFLSNFSELIGNAANLERVLNARNRSEIIKICVDILNPDFGLKSK